VVNKKIKHRSLLDFGVKDVLQVRKGLLCVLVLMFLLQSPIIGEAATWVKVAESSGNSPKMIKYIDLDSIQTTKSGAREVWTKTTFDPPNPTTDNSGRKVNSDKSLSFIVYTPDKYYCTQEIIEYYTSGKSASFSYKCELKKIPPETLAEADWNYLFK